MSGCVYEPVLVGINDKKLEQEERKHSSQLGVGIYALLLRVLTCRGELQFHLEKSFYP